MTEDEKIVWHHQLNRHKFEQTPRDSKVQGSLACCSLWNHNDSHMNHWGLNNNNGIVVLYNQGREVKEEKKKMGRKKEEKEREKEKNLSRVVEKDAHASIWKSEFFVLEGIF